MTKKGLKNQLTGYKKIIHDEMFKIDKEKMLQQYKEYKYVEFYYNTRKYPNIEEYDTTIQEKYKEMTSEEALKLYVKIWIK